MIHLQAGWIGNVYLKGIGACGNTSSICVPWRSMKQVTCKNCLDLIERNVEAKWFKPIKAAVKGE